MSKREAQKRHKDLVVILNKHNHLYHTLDKPEISDYEYDKLFEELCHLENQYPDFKAKDSPSQKTGGQILTAFEKKQHKEPMLSLQNTYSTDEIILFEEKIHRLLQNQDIELKYFCTPKLDGVAIELVYENGELVSAITRGDGYIGENVLENVKTIKSIPLKMQTKTPPKRIDIRGEILIFKKDFEKINQSQEELELNLFANPRNAAAGTLRQLDPKIAASRNLKIYCYALGHHEGITFSSQSEFENQLITWGIPALPQAKSLADLKQSKDKLGLLCGNIEDVITYYNYVETLRTNLPYEIDGVVAKIDSIPLQEELGFVARSPRWAFATKYKPVQAETLIEDIIVQVGRTGAITPVAIMSPVKVGGVTVTHATLHNQDEVDRKDVRIGDTISIHRAGDVIPEIVEVNLKKRPKDSIKYKLPTTCPACNKKTSRQAEEAILRCTNLSCPNILCEALKHFISRNAMNIDHVGSRLIDVLFEKKLVTRFSDIYRLKKEDISNLERQGEKSAANAIKSIEKSKNVTLAKFIFALGVRHVGQQTARTLAKHYRTVDSFLNASEEELLGLPDVGPKVCNTLVKILKQKKFIKEVKDLIACGITITDTSPTTASSKLKDTSFVITGTLPVGRNDAKTLLESHGARVGPSVTKKTNYLLAGEKGGSKLAKAEQHGVEVIDWDQLQKMI